MLSPTGQRHNRCQRADAVAFIILQHDDWACAGLFATERIRQIAQPDIAASDRNLGQVTPSISSSEATASRTDSAAS